MNIGKALKDVMAKKGISLQQLADAAGVPLETLRNIYYGKVKDPKASTIFELSKALDVSMNSLMGEPLSDEQRLIMNYRMSSKRGKAVIDLWARIERYLTQREKTMAKRKITCLIPIGNVVDGINYNSCNMIEVETSNPDAYIAIEITTNYFAPAYCEGDKILLENRFPVDGERAVFVHDGKAYFRLYQKQEKGYALKCLNGRGNDMLLKRMDEIECIGTCIGVIRE